MIDCAVMVLRQDSLSAGGLSRALAPLLPAEIVCVVDGRRGMSERWAVQPGPVPGFFFLPVSTFIAGRRPDGQCCANSNPSAGAISEVLVDPLFG
jgi:hypothetical protein